MFKSFLSLLASFVWGFLTTLNYSEKLWSPRSRGMAKIIPGGGVAEIRGKLGGAIFSRNASGMYMRPMAVPVQPGTTLQLKNRNLFQNVSAAWALLGQTQQDAWRACSTIVIDNLGRPMKLSGYALYIYVNKNLTKIGAAKLDIPPADWSVPQLMTNITIDCSAALVGPPARKTIQVTFLPTPLDATTGIQISATQKVTLGRSVMKGRDRQLAAAWVAGVSPLDVTSAYEGIFGQMAAADIDTCKIFFKAVFINTTNGMLTRGVAGGCIYGQTAILLA